MSYLIRKTGETIFIQDDKNKYVVSSKDWENSSSTNNNTPQKIAESVVKNLGG